MAYYILILNPPWIKKPDILESDRETRPRRLDKLECQAQRTPFALEDNKECTKGVIKMRTPLLSRCSSHHFTCVRFHYNPVRCSSDTQDRNSHAHEMNAWCITAVSPLCNGEHYSRGNRKTSLSSHSSLVLKSEQHKRNPIIQRATSNLNS